MKANGTPVEQSSQEETFTENDIKRSTVKEFGAFYLYRKIGEETGLLNILKEIFPDRWEQIFNIACYLVSSGDPLMYCVDWMEKTEAFQCGALSPAAITEMYKDITFADQSEFFEKWAAYRDEKEYLALDITSVSSYSELIQDVEWGYNRDREHLPQINLCMLMGEESGLPVFQTTYSGSIGDVSTLKSILKIAAALPLKKLLIVMDKAFGKIKNIDAMLSDKQDVRFLVATSFNLAFSCEAVKNERGTIDTIENTIIIGDDSVRGVTRRLIWGDRHTLSMHIYYNALNAAKIKEDMYSNVASMLEILKQDPTDKKKAEKYKTYLEVKAGAEHEGCEIAVRHDVVNKKLSHKGWLVLVGNQSFDATKALAIYRAKDVVEKGFYRMKNCLDLGRPRVHGDATMQSKVFVSFIALILECRIHRVMLMSGLYKTMTMKKLILTLEKLRIQHIKGKDILFPLTKVQKGIFKAFHFEVPK
jgi:transposase